MTPYERKELAAEKFQNDAADHAEPDPRYPTWSDDEPVYDEFGDERNDDWVFGGDDAND